MTLTDTRSPLQRWTDELRSGRWTQVRKTLANLELDVDDDGLRCTGGLCCLAVYATTDPDRYRLRLGGHHHQAHVWLDILDTHVDDEDQDYFPDGYELVSDLGTHGPFHPLVQTIFVIANDTWAMDFDRIALLAETILNADLSLRDHLHAKEIEDLGNALFTDDNDLENLAALGLLPRLHDRFIAQLQALREARLQLEAAK